MLKKQKKRCFRMGLLLIFAAVLVIECYQVQAPECAKAHSMF